MRIANINMEFIKNENPFYNLKWRKPTLEKENYIRNIISNFNNYKK